MGRLPSRLDPVEADRAVGGSGQQAAVRRQAELAGPQVGAAGVGRVGGGCLAGMPGRRHPRRCQAGRVGQRVGGGSGEDLEAAPAQGRPGAGCRGEGTHGVDDVLGRQVEARRASGAVTLGARLAPASGWGLASRPPASIAVRVSTSSSAPVSASRPVSEAGVLARLDGHLDGG